MTEFKAVKVSGGTNMIPIDEFNLSDKIDNDVGMIDTIHVKEFIRLLKEEIEPLNATQEKIDWIMNIIDELAGDKLK